MILFDHSRAFRSSKEFCAQLMFGRNGIKASSQGTPWLFKRLPRWFVENVKALTFESIQAAVGDALKDKEIKAIMDRKALLLREIDDMIKEQGEAAVIY